MTYTKRIVLLAVGFIALPLGAQPLVPVAKSLAKEASATGVSGVSKGMLKGIEGADLLKVNLHPHVDYPFYPYNFMVAPENLSPEAKALWEKSKPAGQQLGLAVVLHDQNAILDNALKEQGGKGLEEAEFQAQQQELKKATQEMEKTLLVNTSFVLHSRIPRDFSGWDKFLAKIDSGVDNATIQRLFDGVAQPIFPVMTKGEMETFASLPSLATQKAYIEDSMALCKEQMQRIINKDITTISDEEFSTYYLQKARLDYFQQVQKALADATEKRTSLILREPVALEEGMPAMTDAQRIGYVQYQKDKLAKRVSQVSSDKDVLRENLAQNVKLQEQELQLTREINHLQELYGPYARAEAWGVPYEKSLHIGEKSILWIREHDPLYPQMPNTTFPKEFYKGYSLAELEEKENAALLNFSDRLSGRLKSIERELESMRNEVPTGPEFYARYYKLSHMEQVYKSHLNDIDVYPSWYYGKEQEIGDALEGMY